MPLQRNDEIDDIDNLMTDVKVHLVEDEDSDIDVDEIDETQIITEVHDAEVIAYIEKLVNDDFEMNGMRDDIEVIDDIHVIETEVIDEIQISLIIVGNDDIDETQYGETEVNEVMQYEHHNVVIIDEVLVEIDDVLYIEIEVIDENLHIDIIQIVVLMKESDIDVNEYDDQLDDDNIDLC